MEGFRKNLIAGYVGEGKTPLSRIHTAYILYIGEDSSILGTNDMFGDKLIHQWVSSKQIEGINQWQKNMLKHAFT